MTNELNFSEAYILSNPSSDVEAFFEGESLRPEGNVNSYNNKKIVLRETSAATHSYKHNDTDLDSFDIDSANFTADPVVNSVAGPNVYAASVATAATGGTITIGTLPNADGNVTVTIDSVDTLLRLPQQVPITPLMRQRSLLLL